MKFSTFPDPLPIGFSSGWMLECGLVVYGAPDVSMPSKKRPTRPFSDIQVYTQWAHKIANYEPRKAALVVSEFPLFVRNPLIQKTSTRPWEGGECGKFLLFGIFE